MCYVSLAGIYIFTKHYQNIYARLKMVTMIKQCVLKQFKEQCVFTNHVKENDFW